MPIKERVESWIRDLEEEVAQLQGLIDALKSRLLEEADISVGSERVLTLLKRHQPDIFEMTKNGWWHISRNTSRKSA